MESLYTAYTKEINGVIFYFVKKYQTFPEYKDIPSILETYGMHTDFAKACKIALITDKEIQQHLLNTLEDNTANAKVIQINPRKTEIYNFRNWQINPMPLLKLLKVR